MWTRYCLLLVILFPLGAQGGSLDLIETAKKGEVATVLSLLKQGATINAADSRGGTALMWAAARGDPPMVPALLDEGADTEAKDSYGGTALMGAV